MEKLESDVQKRYKIKINQIGYDPYDIPAQFFTSDHDRIPILTYYDLMNYLIYETSAYTGDQKRNYKSMDSYKLFVDGWVRDVSWKEDTEFYVIKSKVKTIKKHINYV